MAIKAIINNTEKEIEQIKNSNEQDIDYVYSRIGDTEVEGEPPISIKSVGGNLADYRIYGNTVGGESVGDRTGNLFDKNLCIEHAILSQNGDVNISDTNAASVSDFIPVTSNNSYTINNTGSIRGKYYKGDYSAYQVSDFDFQPNQNSNTFVIPESVKYIRFTINNAVGVESVMLCEGSTLLPYEPYGYRVPVTVSNGTDTLTTPIYLPEQIRKVGDEAEYIDYGERKLHRVGADDIDVTLPALSTIKGTNTLSVGTSIQPSNIYIKDNFDYKRVFTATRVIEDELPLNYRSIEDSDSTLNNYRIYGNTVGGESVGDRTANLIQGSIKNANIGNDGKINTSNEFFLVYAPVVTGESYTISNNNGTNVYAFYNAVPSTETATSYDSSRLIFSTSTITFVSPITGYIAVRLANTAQDIMINPGSTAVPYEPVGYRVPVTVEGKNLFDETYPSIVSNTIKYKSIYVGDGQFTLSTTASVYSGTTVLFLLAGITAKGADSATNGVHANQTRSVASIDGYVTIAYRIRGTIDPRNYNTMLNAGSTPLPYEPYHAPITTPIYLPEQIKKVGDEAEYIDYAEQKMHRVRKNLFSSRIEQGSFDGITGVPNNSSTRVRSHEDDYIFLTPGVYKISAMGVEHLVVYAYDLPDVNAFNYNLSRTNWAPLPSTITINTSAYYKFGFCKTNNPIITPSDVSNIMLNTGSTALPYEPYIEDTEVDVTLPALPTIKGTNVLSVGTAVQPSGVEIKGHIK